MRGVLSRRDLLSRHNVGAVDGDQSDRMTEGKQSREAGKWRRVSWGEGWAGGEGGGDEGGSGRVGAGVGAGDGL